MRHRPVRGLVGDAAAPRNQQVLRRRGHDHVLALPAEEVQRLVGKRRQVRGRPVVAEPGRVVDGALDLGVRHLGRQPALRLQRIDRRQHVTQLGLRPGEDADDGRPRACPAGAPARTAPVGRSGTRPRRRAVSARRPRSGSDRCARAREPPRTATGAGRTSRRAAGGAGTRGLVAMPKLPLPPCSAQNSSLFSSSLAVTTRPSAVTSSTSSRLSHASPHSRSSQPEPPPSVRPATPVDETRPPVVASPCSCVARSKALQVAPPPTVAVLASGSTSTRVHAAHVDDESAVDGARAGDAVAS